MSDTLKSEWGSLPLAIRQRIHSSCICKMRWINNRKTFCFENFPPIKVFLNKSTTLAVIRSDDYKIWCQIPDLLSHTFQRWYQSKWISYPNKKAIAQTNLWKNYSGLCPHSDFFFLVLLYPAGLIFYFNIFKFSFIVRATFLTL